MDAIADRLAIYDLCTTYAEALDIKDWALFATIWVPDCDVHYPGDVHLQGIDVVSAYCERALSRFRATQHLLGNHRVTIDGDQARSKIYLQASHIFPEAEGGRCYTLGGYYEDILVRTPAGWRIKTRTLTSLWTETAEPAQRR
ncbi:MAG: nuclear transport factor 2 family protein [Dehalococcoidia bacterium]